MGAATKTMSGGLVSSEGNKCRESPCHVRGSKLCKVPGCSADLQRLGKPYHLKKRLCPAHMKADAVKFEGCGEQLFRYCQQCGKLEPLTHFQGARRSCRASLIRRRSHADDQDERPRSTQQQQQQQHAVAQEGVKAQEQWQHQQPTDVAPHSNNSHSAADTPGGELDAAPACNSIQQSESSHYWASLVTEACVPGATYTGNCKMQPLQLAVLASDNDTETQEDYLDMLVQQEISNALAEVAGTDCNMGRCSSKERDLELEMMIEDELLAAAAMTRAGMVVNTPTVLPLQQHFQAAHVAQHAQPCALPLQLQAMACGVPAEAITTMAAATVPAGKLEACNTLVPAAGFATGPVMLDGTRAESSAWVHARLQKLREHAALLQQSLAAMDALQQELQQQMLQRTHSSAYSACSTAPTGPWQLH